MKINDIYYHESFEKKFKKLPDTVKRKALKSEKLFRDNPFHPSLRLHKLKGKLDALWSISIDKAYRIIFEPMKNGDIIFISVGRHAIYEDIQ